MSLLAQHLDELNTADPYADLTEALDVILADVNPDEIGSESFQAAFRLFERHPLCDFGSPGPLVHWLEGAYPRYLEELVASVERRPTEYTLWMVNRILNANIDATTRAVLVGVLKAAVNRIDIEQTTISSAQEWLQMQG